MVSVEDVMPRLASADFRTTVKYTGPLEHQYIMSHWRDDYLNLWLDMRELIATQGVVRPFFKSKQIWKYVDLPDGFTIGLCLNGLKKTGMKRLIMMRIMFLIDKKQSIIKELGKDLISGDLQCGCV